MNNRELYDNAFLTAFGINLEQLGELLVYQSISTWDSVGHMALMAQLEETFDLMMEIDDIIDFSGYEKGKEILKKYNIEI